MRLLEQKRWTNKKKVNEKICNLASKQKYLKNFFKTPKNYFLMCFNDQHKIVPMQLLVAEKRRPTSVAI